MDATSSQPHVVLLCEPSRRAGYEAACAASGVAVSSFDDVVTLLAQCVRTPPIAVLLDTATSALAGRGATNALLGMRMRWPVMRCMPQADGAVNVMCDAPRRFGKLGEALSSLARDDGHWSSRDGLTYIRVPIECRVRFREVVDKDWQKGNCTDVSANGAYIVTYAPLPEGANLLIELLDIVGAAVRMPATVVRVRRWEDGPTPPGMGVSFDPRGVPTSMVEKLAATLTQRLARGLPVVV